MSDQVDWIEKRAYVRIQRQFITKYRDRVSQEFVWEFPVIKDISEGGCYFHSSVECKIGQLLDIEIQFPRLKEPMAFVGEVMRIDDQSGDLQRYGVAVQFVDMEQEKKKIFIETLKFFIKQQD